MWKPDESLDDFIARPDAEVKLEAPRSVWLERTGEVEVLKPLTNFERRAKRGRYAFRSPYQPLWFRRFLVAGSGALVIILFVLVSAILVGINEPGGGPDVAVNETSDEPVTQPESRFGFDISSFSSVAGVANIVRSNIRRRPARPTIQLAAIKPKRQFRPPLRPDEPNFMPTTLVIYAGNGVINTRIEPWFPDSDKKTTTFNN